MPKALIFAMRRSGGSYVCNILSGGLPILAEPILPNDGFATTESENERRFSVFNTRATASQVIKLCDFDPFLKRLHAKGQTIPTAWKKICLFRHPYKQIASHLFKFKNWDDNWANREYFWQAIEEYREFAQSCNRIKTRYPATMFLKYEDALGTGWQAFIETVYGVSGAVPFLPFATTAKEENYILGPIPDGEPWRAGDYSLSVKEKAWVAEKLGVIMDGLGYGR